MVRAAKTSADKAPATVAPAGATDKVKAPKKVKATEKAPVAEPVAAVPAVEGESTEPKVSARLSEYSEKINQLSSIVSSLKSEFKALEKSDALWEDLWLLSYEAAVRGWGGMSDAHVRADPHFEAMRLRNVRFYDSAATIPPLFTPRPNALKEHNLQTIAELLELEDLDDVFEYEDEEDEYGSPVEPEEDDDEL